MKPESTEISAFEGIVFKSSLLNDLDYLVEYKHTGSLEVYHSLMLKYCPKRQHFSYRGMMARTQLAVLDHNNHLGRTQASTKDGRLKQKISHSKVSGNWSAKKVMEKKDYEYLQEMLQNVHLSVKGNLKVSLPSIIKLPKNIAKTPRPSKEELLKHNSRFSWIFMTWYFCKDILFSDFI